LLGKYRLPDLLPAHKERGELSADLTSGLRAVYEELAEPRDLSVERCQLGANCQES
jgi:hypothetical protein